MFRKIWLIFLLIFINFLFPNASIGQELPFLKEVQIKANVVLNNNIYFYSYSVTNGVNSGGELWLVDIDITYPRGGTILSSEGLTIPRGKTLFSFEHQISRLKVLKEINMVPIGMEKPLGDWTAGITINGTATWGSGDNFEFKPGNTAAGFKIISYGLPGIRDFKASPWLDSDADYYPDWESVKDAKDPSEAIIAKVKELTEKVSFKGKTIGPTAPPADFKPVNFVDYIISMKHEAFTLGCITNKGIENSLDVKLDNAKKKIEQGNITAAKNILNAFLNEVEAQKDKHLTSEAYGLLKYNVEYLKGRL